MPQHARGKEEEKEREREGAEVVKGRAADPRSCIALPTGAGRNNNNNSCGKTHPTELKNFSYS